MKKKILFIGILAAVVFISCDNSTSINIITPKDGQIFNSGDMVEVKAKISDPDILEGIILTATSQSGDTIYQFSDDANGNSYNLLKSFQLTSQGMYDIKVRGLGGYGGSKTVTITVE